MSENNEVILVTGAAGFIGFSLIVKLLELGENVVGLDNINSYYDVELKYKRLSLIEKKSLTSKGKWFFFKASLENSLELKEVFGKFSPKVVINLAAQAGVRYSLLNPNAYIQSNIVGFANLLEECRLCSVKNLLYASSSSVYGANTNLPYDENHPVNHPISFYAATKKSNELLAHTYSHIYNLPCTGMRFFTVYGPWGRPDMAPMIFSKAILSGKSIKIFNHGKMKRDFTYIDDVIESIVRCCKKPATPNTSFNTSNPEASSSFAPHKILNVGNGSSIDLMHFIQLLENEFNKKVIKDFQPIQPGEVQDTFANTESLFNWINYKPTFSVEKGIKLFADWYKVYHENYLK